VAGSEPGDTGTPQHEPGARRLAEPPSARYARAAGVGRRAGDTAAGGALRSGLPGPFARAAVVALVGAAAMAGVAAFTGSALALLFVAAISGGAVGLALFVAGFLSDWLTLEKRLLPFRRDTRRTRGR